MTEIKTVQSAKTMTEMADEVLEWCHSKGWYDTPVSCGELMALLHSEVAEVTEAWRVHGLDDFTGYDDLAVLAGKKDPSMCKPEGVGSEFADILIRWLDDSRRLGVDPELVVNSLPKLSESFLENMNALHTLIAAASTAFYENDFWWGRKHARIISFLKLLCEHYGIDLPAEYERKMEYNRTRAYRHGGKRQ